MEQEEHPITGDFFSPNEDLRRWAIISASKNRDASALTVLFALLETDSDSNRRHVVRALGNIGGEASKAMLLKLLSSESGLILGDVARALGRLQCKEALPLLASLTSHEVGWVRESASWALKQLQ